MATVSDHTQTNHLAREMADMLSAGLEPAPAPQVQQGDTNMVAQKERELQGRLDGSGIVDAGSIAPVERPVRTRDLPPPPTEAFDVAEETSEPGWYALVGELSGGSVFKEIVLIRADGLVTDPVSPVREHRVRELMAVGTPTGFDASKSGALKVSLRENGDRVVVDGNHRTITVRDRLKRRDFQFRCEIYRHLTFAQEAVLARSENAGIRRTPLEFLLWDVQGQQPRALGIERALAVHGAYLRGARGRSSGWPMVETGRDLERIYDLFGEGTLADVIGHAVRSWAHQRTAFNGQVLMALAYVRRHYGSSLHPNDLDERLKTVTARELRAAGVAVQQTHKPRVPNGLAQCIAVVLVGLYNKRRTTRRLAEWEWEK